MHVLTVHDFGVQIVFREHIESAEARDVLAETAEIFEGFDQPYGVLIDVRQVHRIDPEALAVLVGGQHLPHASRVSCAVIVVDSRTLAPEHFGAAPPAPNEKRVFLDAAQDPFWHAKAIALLKHTDATIPRAGR